MCQDIPQWARLFSSLKLRTRLNLLRYSHFHPQNQNAYYCPTIHPLALLSPALAVSINNTLYIITNAETPSLDRPGLTPIGLQRRRIASLRSIFADLNLGLIIVCKPNNKTGACMPANDNRLAARRVPGARARQPLRDVVRRLCRQYTDDLTPKNSTQAILVVWDSAEMGDLLENLDIELPGGDDDDDADDVLSHADLLLIKNLKQTLIETSMNCTGIDGPAPGTF
ncbi:hypothetical protein B0H14DRAFT_2923131 [Mycena olivaceomarginata]|nr:hypothetical protein B0H14DRAFT_2923131 [Mycena olivaceomarginata]